MSPSPGHFSWLPGKSSSGRPAADWAASPWPASLAGTLSWPMSSAAPTAACTMLPSIKRVVQLFMAGAASHIDLFDYKPRAGRRHGQPSDFGEPVEAFQNGLGPWLRPVWDFRPYGQCGKMLCDVVAPLGDGRRRHRLRPQHGRQDGRPQPGHAAASDRLQSPRLSRHGLLGQLRTGQHERQPADVRGPARSSRPRLQRHQELGQRLPAGPASGHGHLPRPAQPDRRSVPGPGRGTSSRRPATEPPSTLLGRAQPHARGCSDPATTGSKHASAATSWPHACSWPPRKPSIFRRSRGTS